MRGALGTVIASVLVRAGVGRVSIIDRDFIEYHNLQRQILFDEKDVKENLPKAVAAERHLRKVNSEIAVEDIVSDINYTNIEDLIRGSDVILDGTDNLETRFLINDTSLKLKIPWIYGGAIDLTGMTMTIIPYDTPCFRCIIPGETYITKGLTCETAGVISSAPWIVASLQASEAIKILVGSNKINRDLVTLAERMKAAGQVEYNDFMLRFRVESREMLIFRDGRAIVKDTNDEAFAKNFYTKYVGA